jgi:hypothetical protein
MINKIILLQRKIKIDVINDTLDIETINNYFKSINIDIIIENIGDKIYREPVILYNVYCKTDNYSNTEIYNNKYPEYKDLYNNMIIIYPDGSIRLLF